MKKMKKRRELDALVNGKLGRRKKGQHELLRNADSESSEAEEFSIPPKSVLRNSSSCRFCATCMTVCGFFLLAVCVAAIAGLVWVHIEMKKEVDQLRSHVQQVQNAPQKSLDQLASRYDSLDKNLKELKTTVNAIKKNATRLSTQVKNLQTDVTALNKQSKKKPAPVASDDDVAKSVAVLGSSVTSLKEDYQDIVDRITALETSHQEVKELSHDLGALNSSMLTHYAGHTLALRNLENTTESLKLRLEMVEGEQSLMSMSRIREVIKSALHDALLSDKLENTTEDTEPASSEHYDELHDAIVWLNSSLGQLVHAQEKIEDELSQKDYEVAGLQGKVDPMGLKLQDLEGRVSSVDDRLTIVEDNIESSPTNKEPPRSINNKETSQPSYITDDNYELNDDVDDGTDQTTVTAEPSAVDDTFP